MRKSYGYEGNPLAPLLEPLENEIVVPDSYMVYIKKSADEAKIKYHYDRLDEDINEELNDSSKEVVSHIKLKYLPYQVMVVNSLKKFWKRSGAVMW